MRSSSCAELNSLLKNLVVCPCMNGARADLSYTFVFDRRPKIAKGLTINDVTVIEVEGQPKSNDE